MMSSGRQVSPAQIGVGIGVALLAVAVAALLRGRGRAVPARLGQPRTPVRTRTRGWHLEHASDEPKTAVAAGRRLNRAAGMLALSVLADSAVEHYRGSFHNPAMITPLFVSSVTLALSAHGLTDPRRAKHPLRHANYVAAALTGAAGSGFHLYNVVSRPGRIDWQNLFYGAPLGAPMAILLSGILGAMAERVRDAEPDTVPRVVGIPAGRAIAGLTALGLLGTTGEVALLHFRGAFHDPFMVLPVTLPPVGAILLGKLALGPKSSRPSGFTRWWLRLIAAMGLAGVGFHAYGVSRNMGGWGNWQQNVLNGPPLPAPPSFTGLALAGLAAVRLLEDHPNA